MHFQLYPTRHCCKNKTLNKGTHHADTGDINRLTITRKKLRVT